MLPDSSIDRQDFWLRETPCSHIIYATLAQHLGCSNQYSACLVVIAYYQLYRTSTDACELRTAYGAFKDAILS